MFNHIFLHIKKPCVLGLFLASAFVVAHAAPPPVAIAASANNQDAPPSSGFFDFINGINRSNNLLGDMWGLRSKLSRSGITFSLQETSELLGNTRGGAQKGAAYDGLTQAVLQLNTQRALGWYGGLVNVSTLHIHGQNLSSDNLLTLQTASGIEADRGFRLWEMWYDQKMLDEDRLDIKVGQQSIDQEFIVSNNAQMFVNTMFGWPMLPSADMPAGGPAYPLSALGLRLSARPVDGLTVLAGIFNASPTGKSSNANNGDPQLQNPHGTNFALGNGTLSLLELQFAYPSLGSMVQADEAPPLGWTYRIGAWYNSQSFADMRFDQQGLSLAHPASNRMARQHHGNASYYAVADTLVWRSTADLNRTLSFFARVMTTPYADRNLIDKSANVGLVMRAPFNYRTDDVLGIGLNIAHISHQAAGLDSDNNQLANTFTPVRTSERVVEITYQYQVKPWLQLQPDVQYVVNPGAGVANPNNVGQRVKNELVIGLRTNIAF